MKHSTIKISLVTLLALNTLYAKELTLDTITVTSASKKAQSINNITSNVNVITKEEIQEKNFKTVADAINTVAGINYTSNGGLGQNTSVFVRGFSSNRVLVMIDGIRYNDITSTGGAPFAHLMLADIEQIEIVKGAQSGVWGADATAGVINIITTKAKDGLHGSILAEYGSFQTKKVGALVSYKSDEYYIKVSSQNIDNDGFTAQAPRNSDIDNYEDDSYENTTTNIKFGFNINGSNKVDISHTMIDAQTHYDGFDPITYQPDANALDYSKTKDSFSQINFNHIDSFNEVDIYAKLSVFDRNYPLSSYSKEFDGQVQEYGIKSTITYNKNDFLVAGVDYKGFKHKNDLQEKYNNKAIFITNSNEFDFYGKTIISESIRYDDYDKFDDKLTGKAGIKHFCNIIDGLTASANIGWAYNVPTLYHLYSYFGNSSLDPEDTISYDFTLGYKDFKVTYFNSTTKDMIDYDFSTYSYNNLVGKTKIKGIEVEYSTEVYTDILVSANYTWLDAKNDAGQELRRRPKDTLKLSVDYYGITNLHLGAFGEYVGRRYDKDNKQGEQTGKYTVLNLVANYDINKNFSVYAKVDNLFDKYYQIVDGYASAPLSAFIGIKANF